MNRKRIAGARQKVWAWFETNIGTANDCSMATGIPMNTIHAAICVMRSHYLPQTANEAERVFAEYRVGGSGQRG